MKKRNRKRKLTRSQKGISLIALTTTILVLAIVTSIVVYNSKNNIMIKQYKKLENDIDVLNNKVGMYYLKNGELPICMRSDRTYIEYNDNRLSLFSAQRGKCAITGYEFLAIEEVHCHHKTPRKNGGKDNYQNLILVLPDVHKLIHAKREQTILKYLKILDLNNEQLEKVNKLRIKAELPMIVS